MRNARPFADLQTITGLADAIFLLPNRILIELHTIAAPDTFIGDHFGIRRVFAECHLKVPL